MATDNKRIAKNTVFLYLRMILVMGVTLYTSRVVLEQLGAGDYGVYAVVGGVVAMFAFINSSMMSATQRYLNIELGRGTRRTLSDVFATSLTVHGIIAAVAILIGESVGLWFVNAKLVIPQDSMTAANVVYQSALFSFGVSIMQAPFNAAIIAYERMNAYALISIIEVVMKLGTALALVWIPSDKLACFGVFVFITHLVVGILYVIYVVRKFDACRIRFVYIRSLFGDMLGFAGWNLLGNIASLVRTQGISIMLNVFFGPVINAAKGLADQIQGAVNQFATSFQVAMNPQITKNYALHELGEMQTLAYRGLKFSSIMLIILVLPISTSINTILDLWLTDVPRYTALFTVLILVDLVVTNLFGQALIVSMTSTGRIRNYQIVLSSIWLLILPVSYLLLRYGFAPETVFYANIGLNVVVGVLRLWFCNRNLGYSYSAYFRTVFLPVTGVIMVCTVAMILLKTTLFEADNLVNFIILTGISILLTVTVSWFVALSAGERGALVRFVKSKLHGR